MKTHLPSSREQFLSFVFPGKIHLLIITILFGFCSDLSASIKPVNKIKDKSVSKVPSRDIKIGGYSKKSLSSAMGLPAVSYAGPQTYLAGMAITPLSPTGGGAAAPSYSTSTTTLGSGFNIPAGVAVDSKGNIFIGDQNNNAVKEIPAGSNTPIVIGTGFSTPDGVAVDAQENVYVANDGGNTVEEIPFANGAYGAPVTLGGSFSFLQPFDVAVDTKGNVYVADRGNNAVEEIPVGGGAVFAIGSGFATPTGVAVDAYGNVYVADNGNSAVKEIPAGGGAPITLGSGFSSPFTAAVDGSGNVFVADYGNHQVKEIPINGGAPISIGSGFGLLFGTAVDVYNNVYVTDYGINALKQIQPTGGYYINPALPQGLSFNNITGTISGTPTAASPATTYTITASNASGSSSTTLTITVNALTMSYASPQTYVAGTKIAALTPTGGGAAAPAYATTTTTLGSGFNIPAGLAVDSKGNIFVGDQNNNAVKEIPGGTGTPVVIGTGFAQPDGVAVDAQENVYVANDGGNTVQEIPFVNGTYGTPITLGSGFSQPFDVAVDTKGNVYVADKGNNAVKELPVGGAAPVTLGSGFNGPTGVAVDAYGNVYVADFGNSAVKEIPAGNGTVITLGSGFIEPFTVAVDGTGNVFLTDYGHSLVKEIPVGNGTPVSIGGTSFGTLFGTAVDNANNVYVTDYSIGAVKKIQPIGGYYINPALPLGLSFNNTTGKISGTPVASSPATVYTITAYNQYGSSSAALSITVNALAMNYASPKTYLAGTAITPLNPTGGGAAAPAYATTTTTLGSGFNIPAGLAVDSKGNIFVGDQNNNAVKEIPGGTGTPITIASGLSTPDGVAVDAQENVYVANDAGNTVLEIPFVNGTYGTPITLGSGFSQPFDVAVDTKGNVYVADKGNNAIKEIPAGGAAPVTLGSGFNGPTGVAVDAYGNVYVADFGNGAVKEIPAGNGTVITLGSGFIEPFTVAVDGTGNVFLTDYGHSLVKEIPVGNGTPVSIGGTSFGTLFGTAVDMYNNVYVTDYSIGAVKKIQPIGGYYISPALPLGLSFNNTTGTISGTPTAASPATTYTVTAYNQYGITSKTLTITVNAVAMSYAGPQTWYANYYISPNPLSPTGGGAAAPAYATTTTTLGSGFNIPAGLAVDSKGNIFVGDQNNNAVKEIPGGTGTPVVIGTGFAQPDGVAVDAQENVYVANDGGNTVQEIPFVNGTYGTPITLGSGFSQPFDVAVDTKGNVYVADKGNNAVKELPVGGAAPVTLGSGFNGPTGVAVDAYGNVYVADFGNSAVKEIPAGNGTVITLGSGFIEPFTVAVDGTGNVFLTDYGHSLVKEIPVGNGTPVSIGGTSFGTLFGTAVDMYNNVYVTDYSIGAVKKIQPIGGYYISPALPFGIQFNNATGAISFGSYVASPSTNYTITAYNQYGSSTANLNITVLAVAMSYAGPQTYTAGIAISPLTPINNGNVYPPATAAAPAYATTTTTLGSGFNIPAGLAVDSKGNIFVGDQNNNAVKEIPGGTGTPVVIGTGFAQPDGVAVDAQENVYVANDGGNTVQEIPFVNGTYGTPITLGSGFSQPFDVAVDTKGNVYVADKGNNAIKEIPAGGAAPVTLGSGFNGPTGVAVDAYGNVYVADFGNSAVKEIPAGNGTVITLGSGFIEPFTVAVDGTGNVFLTDYGHSLVKEIPVGNGTPVSIGGTSFGTLFGTAVDMYNNVYVTDYSIGAVKKIQPIGGYYISPALPLGLSFNNTTGTISGTPTAASPATTYTVTAYNGVGGNSTTVNLKVTTNANLAALTLSSGALSPEFAFGTTGYTANVANSIASITVTPTAADPNATIVVNGTTVASGTASQSLPLAAGPNVITAEVIGRDGVSITNYTVTVTRAPSTNANLSTLGQSVSGLTPAFSSGTTSYTINVSNATASMTLKPVSSDPNATITVNGTAVASGTMTSPIALTEGGATVITTVVTAQNGTTTKTYTVTVTRGPSSDASLANLVLSKGTLNPAFSAGTTGYNANVASTITNITVTPSTTDGNATIMVNGAAVTSGTASGSIPLAIGANMIAVVVTAQDGVTTSSYTITVGRGASNANLSTLGQSVGGLTPAFSSGTTSYTESVSYTNATMTLKPVSGDANATIKVNGTTVASGTTTSPIALAEGAQTVIIAVVTAQDGVTTKTYTLTVTRGPSTDASLANLVTSKGTLSPAFATGTTSYTTSVAYSISTITVTPTTTDANATIEVNGTAVTSGTASGPVTLAEGANTPISVVITAQNGTTMETYTVTVSRGPSTNANLSTLGQSVGGLTPAFSSGTTSYTENVSNATSSMTLKPVSSDANATIKVNGTTVVSGTMTSPIALAVGSNPISTVVTAQDGVTTKTYNLIVTRASGAADSYDPGISVTKPTETPAMAEDGIQVHQGVSPNGDGINDFLQIDNISQYPDNKLMIMNRNGQLVFETQGYDNSSKVFDGHSNKNGQMQLPGTYFYQLDYTVSGITKHKTGFIVLKY